MRIDILTLFPGMFEGPLTESILARARERKLLDIRLHDLREFGLGRHKQVDDTPYGGGAGMVLRADVAVPAIESIDGTPVRILLTPRGERLTQSTVEQLATTNHLLLLCGRYEGVDQRIIEGGWIDRELSIGDYVLTGGELPAMVLIDAVARHVPGVLGKEESAEEESFAPSLDRKREYPHYTKPESFRGLTVPDILISGNHGKIAEWRRGQTS
jgi:tRNA (guanine37-N1)-methyltransferase